MASEFRKSAAEILFWAGVPVLLIWLLCAAAAHGQEGLDLPFEPPKLQLAKSQSDPVPVETIEDEGDDPRDTPPPTLFGEELDPEGGAIVYVIDLSCSMSLPEPNPFEVNGVVMSGTRFDRAMAELESSINSLAASMRFSVIRYGTRFVAWKTQVQPASPENKLSAISWARASGCLGMTSTGPAVVSSFSIPDHSHVVLLTDGKPNWDGASVRGPPWHRDLIRNHNERGTTVDVFGFRVRGEARTFCRGVAADSGGTFYEID